ncbi:MAG: hypothetical protein H6575_18455 [Lewinellaceae bacterium]|nr:hypothetical protein [Saprospiraceae bacterium]MCB0544882.1 hypothetical protein [Saprospiraceae bacterium]MCB9356547.1 hypothetical protein [Lewinellaceae bacterium]
MNFQKILFTATLVLAVLIAQPVDAQSDSNNGGDFRSRLWYGGNIGLNFYGYNGGNVFLVGVAPMVGYKVAEPFSIGPRVSLFFSSVKQPGFKAVGLFDVDAGLFARLRVFRGLFFQGEVSNQWYQDPVFYVNGTTDKESNTRVNTRLGAGWNWSQGRGAGTEIGVFYNFAIANDTETYLNPLEYRFGFTWNF